MFRGEGAKKTANQNLSNLVQLINTLHYRSNVCNFEILDTDLIRTYQQLVPTLSYDTKK